MLAQLLWESNRKVFATISGVARTNFTGEASHFEPDEAHQLDGVAFGYDAVAQRVIETHFAVLDVILKMHVAQALAQGSPDLGQSQVVRGDNAERSPIEQRPKETLGAEPAVVGVSAF